MTKNKNSETELQSAIAPLINELKNHKKAMGTIIDRYLLGETTKNTAKLMCVTFVAIYEAKYNRTLTLLNN